MAAGHSIHKPDRAHRAILDPTSILRELCNRDFHRFLVTFWPTICHDPFLDNWHIRYLCGELQEIAGRVARREPNPYDLIINVPPGTTKTSVCSIFFPVWCWTLWPWLRFLTFSYNERVANKAADASKKVLESRLFRAAYPDIILRKGKEGVSDYEISYLEDGQWHHGPGGRSSSSVGGTGTAFHGDILIPDDAINAEQSFSFADRERANRWADQTLPSRKTIKEVAATIFIGQRFHEDDPPGHLLANKDLSLKHICLPADLDDPAHIDLVSPPELVDRYVDGLLDPVRLSRKAIRDLTARLGQYGAAAQLYQRPTSPSGDMFKTDRIIMVDKPPSDASIVQKVRFWDKAGTDPTKEPNQEPAYTVGALMASLASGKFIILDIVRGRWSAEDREARIRATAEGDGRDVHVGHEQEPGSGGKESAQATTRGLAGFHVWVDKPIGNKVARADTFSVQVNGYNVMMLRGDWNHDCMEELKFFPNSRFKDQVDALSGAFARLARKKEVRIGKRDRR